MPFLPVAAVALVLVTVLLLASKARESSSPRYAGWLARQRPGLGAAIDRRAMPEAPATAPTVAPGALELEADLELEAAPTLADIDAAELETSLPAWLGGDQGKPSDLDGGL